MKGSFFEKTSKMDKSIRLIKEHSERIQIKKIRNERGKITTETTEIQQGRSNYYKQLHANKMSNMEEVNKFQRGTTFQDRMRKKQKIQQSNHK